MIWLFYALLSRACFAVCNLIDGHFTTGKLASPYGRMVLFNIFTLFLLPIAYFSFHIKPLPYHLYPWVLASGTTFFLYVIPYLKALKISDTSTVVSLFTLARIFVPFLAYFIVGETLSPPEILGFIIVVLGALWHAYEPHKAKLNFQLILQMTLCGVLMAGYCVFSKRIFNEIHWIDGLFYIYGVAACSAFSLLLDPRLRPEIIETIKAFPPVATSYSLVVAFAFLANIFNFWTIAITK